MDCQLTSIRKGRQPIVLLLLKVLMIVATTLFLK